MLDYSKKKRSVVREGEKNRWGSRGECFILVVVIVITKKNRWISSRFHHGWLVVGGERRRTISHNGRAEWIIKAKFI